MKKASAAKRKYCGMLRNKTSIVSIEIMDKSVDVNAKNKTF